MPISSKQKNQISLLFGTVAFLGGIVAILAYVDNKKNGKRKKAIDEIDLEIKALQLANLKSQKNI